MLLSVISSYLVLGASLAGHAPALGADGGLRSVFTPMPICARCAGSAMCCNARNAYRHHQHGHHAQNYGLPLWDMLFGTLDQPAEARAEAGLLMTTSPNAWPDAAVARCSQIAPAGGRRKSS